MIHKIIHNSTTFLDTLLRYILQVNNTNVYIYRYSYKSECRVVVCIKNIIQNKLHTCLQVQQL